MAPIVQVEHIRAKYGDFFGITVAGYPGKSQLLSCIHSILFYYLLLMHFSEIFLFSISRYVSEAHPDMIQGEGGVSLEGYQNDLAYLKRKVRPLHLSNSFVRLQTCTDLSLRVNSWIYKIVLVTVTVAAKPMSFS